MMAASAMSPRSGTGMFTVRVWLVVMSAPYTNARRKSASKLAR